MADQQDTNGGPEPSAPTDPSQKSGPPKPPRKRCSLKPPPAIPEGAQTLPVTQWGHPQVPVQVIPGNPVYRGSKAERANAIPPENDPWLHPDQEHAPVCPSSASLLKNSTSTPLPEPEQEAETSGGEQQPQSTLPSRAQSEEQQALPQPVTPAPTKKKSRAPEPPVVMAVISPAKPDYQPPKYRRKYNENPDDLRGNENMSKNFDLMDYFTFDAEKAGLRRWKNPRNPQYNGRIGFRVKGFAGEVLMHTQGSCPMDEKWEKVADVVIPFAADGLATYKKSSKPGELSPFDVNVAFKYLSTEKGTGNDVHQSVSEMMDREFHFPPPDPSSLVPPSVFAVASSEAAKRRKTQAAPSQSATNGTQNGTRHLST